MCRGVWLVLYFYLSASICVFLFFFFNDTATTEIYTLSLHDALPIYVGMADALAVDSTHAQQDRAIGQLGKNRLMGTTATRCRSEEHTSELQSHSDLVCRLLLEKKKITHAQ